MATRSMRVKVKTSELLAAVEAKLPEAKKAVAELTAAQTEYDKAKAKADAAYETAVSRWKASLLVAVKKALTKPDADVDVYRYSNSGTTVTVVTDTVPEKPQASDFPVGVKQQFHMLNEAEDRLQRIERTIATLKIAAEDSISITADDYAEYLG